MEEDRRARLVEEGDGRPCAFAGCEEPRYRIPSQYSSYCYPHHLQIRRKAGRKWAYGLTNDQYEELMTRADGRCQICRSQDRLVVDHCHKTNVVRGILCNECNVALGCFKDDPQRLLAAVGYLALVRREPVAV